MQTASRTDLKVDLMQEVERKIIILKKETRTKKNEQLLIKLRKIKVNLEKAKIHSGFFFGNDKLIQEIKARNDSPFGITSIDFPEFHFWLQNQSPIFKKEYINKKLLPYYPIRDAIYTLLSILRSKAKTHNVSTMDGVYQKKLDPALKIDLITITAKKSLRSFPCISSNKYAINVHFNDAKTQNQINKIINFKIGLSSL
jgi:cell division protein ZapD